MLSPVTEKNFQEEKKSAVVKQDIELNLSEEKHISLY